VYAKNLEKKRVGESFDEVAVLTEEFCHTLKDMCDPLCIVNLTKQHTLSGQVIGNGLVLSLLEKERSGDERNVVKLRLADRSRRVAYIVGK
jgi:hypothetical protein